MPPPEWWSIARVDVGQAVSDFINRVQTKAENLAPATLLVGKNPYLFRPRMEGDARLLASMMVDSHLSKCEKAMFGVTLEEIAFAVCHHAKGGSKSSSDGIDLEYDEGETRNLIQIKSGPKWGNKSQRDKLASDFLKATKTLRQGRRIKHVRCIEGICYGASKTTDLGSHIKIVGNDFWYEISGWKGTAQKVYDMIGKHASNGLLEARETASDILFGYLKDQSAATESGEVIWKRILEIVMKE